MSRQAPPTHPCNSGNKEGHRPVSSISTVPPGAHLTSVPTGSRDLPSGVLLFAGALLVTAAALPAAVPGKALGLRCHGVVPVSVPRGQ
jgi:hypothetical protein